MANHVHLDPFAGIAGDMFLGAMIDLGAPLERIVAALEPLGVEPAFTLTAEPTRRQGIRGIDVKVRPAHDHDPGRAPSHSHPAPTHVRPADILAMVDRLDTTDRGRDRARAIVMKLAEAEAHVHGKPIDAVHFHEVGAVDSIVDMLGAAVAVELLEVTTFSCGSLPIGHGFVDCAHGRMPLPAPATAAILRGMAQHGVDRAGETVTPTGAAIVAALTDRFGPLPAMSVTAVGYGAGDRDDPDVPNLLRAYLGKGHAMSGDPATSDER